jgi:TRAP-type mannitol/chloroaromatic compound transport system permease small subunit
MPSLTFVLPHWLYWTGLAIFPLFAMFLARRSTASRKRGYSLPLGYLILVTGGMLGLHRFYLKNRWGLLYILVFLFILYANAIQREARVDYSNAANAANAAETTLSRERSRLANSDEELARLRAQLEDAEEGSISQRSAELRLERAQAQIESRRARVAEAEKRLAEAKPAAAAAAERLSVWRSRAFYAFLVILAGMLADAFLLPSLLREANRRGEALAEPDILAQTDPSIPSEDEVLGRKADEAYLTTGWTGVIDRLSLITGEFVSYWSVIAVFVYYYEVMARYVFNSPTIWAHESMFLMFGMQYLICGAYAMLTENHVRVDVFYSAWSARGKAIADLLTSVFFFIFAGVLLVTSWIFAMDATRVSEVSFTEWRPSYWPMKWAMVVGAVLLLLQGISKFAQDIRTLVSARGA